MSGVFSYLRSFRHLACTDENDGTLLERFRTQRDEQAFATLVQRHGPLILGIIRRLVGPGEQADDVFQATFLVLARKGQSMERWPSVAGWLVQVARRTALQAQAKSARRLRHEQQAASMTSHITTSDPARIIEQQDLATLLDAELDRLPGKYRTPIILCQLQGQSREETARQLGWPLGSVAGRLARGKKLLQDRLLKRGIVPTLTAGALTMTKLEAQVPALLVQATTLLASHVVHKTSQVPASAAITLAQGVMTSMLMTKVKYMAAAVMLACLCVGTGAWAWHGREQPSESRKQPSQNQAKPQRLHDLLQGEWVMEKSNATSLTAREVGLLTGMRSGRDVKLSQLSFWRFAGNQVLISNNWLDVLPANYKHFTPYEIIPFETFDPASPSSVTLAELRGSIKLLKGKFEIVLAPKKNAQDVSKSTENDPDIWHLTLRRASDYDRLEGIWRKEERNPVTNELESAEEMIFKKNMYLRRYIHKGSHHDGPPSVFALNETATPKQIDLDIVSVADANDKLQGYFSSTDKLNRDIYIAETINKNLLRERQLGIYELKDNEFTYQISGAVPFMLKDDKLVPNPQSPLNRSPTAFEPGNNATEAFRSLSVTYKRVDKSLKDSLVLGAPHQEVPAGSTQPNPSPDVSPQILELKQQRLKVAEERMDIWKEMYRAGRASLEESGQLSQQLLDARLALAKDSDMKIKSLEEHLKLLKEFEGYAEKGYQSGSRTKSDLLAVKLRRIEVEIQLEEMKAKKRDQ
ncbi:MAG: sigma-70 family RNA polymerase sigma factor [Planctomycetia bacterium]|nr:sigma-70 family RNA polymerase sigma factor [Planctomycetia bacterium]